MKQLLNFESSNQSHHSYFTNSSSPFEATSSEHSYNSQTLINQPRVFQSHKNCLKSLKLDHDQFNELNSDSFHHSSINSPLSKSRASLHQRIQEINSQTQKLQELKQKSKKLISSQYIPTVDNRLVKKSNFDKPNIKISKVNTSFQQEDDNQNGLVNNTVYKNVNTFNPFYKNYQIEYI